MILTFGSEKQTGIVAFALRYLLSNIDDEVFSEEIELRLPHLTENEQEKRIEELESRFKGQRQVMLNTLEVSIVAFAFSALLANWREVDINTFALYGSYDEYVAMSERMHNLLKERDA